jgi:hypothetical protein
MSAETTLSREEMLERYVLVEALERFFQRMMSPQGGGLTLQGFFPDEIHDLAGDLGSPEQLVSESMEMFSELWPADGDEDEHQPEIFAAWKRANILTAKMFALAASRPDAFAAEACALIDELHEVGAAHA